MTTMTDIGVTGALFLLDTYDTSKLRNYFREKIDKAASAVSSAVEGSLGTPKAREATMDKGVEALKAALDYIRSDAVKDLKIAGTKLNTLKDYAYQTTLNSEALNRIVAKIKGTRTSEELQRHLERILYLYLLEKALSMPDPIDLSNLSPDEEKRFLDQILTPGSQSREDVDEMVRNLLVLFFYERLGVSAVQYGNDLGGDAQIQAVFRDVIEKDRRKTMDSDIDKSINSQEFIRHFLTKIIENYNSGTGEGEQDDAKYFGVETDHIKMIHHRIRNLVNAHNRYLDYIQSGSGINKEIEKIGRLQKVIDDLRGFIPEDQKVNLSHIDSALQNMLGALNEMKKPKADGKLHVKGFKSLDDLLVAESPEGVVLEDVKIVEPNLKRGAEEAFNEDEEEEGSSSKKSKGDEEQTGGEDPPSVDSYEFLRAYHVGELGSRHKKPKTKSGGKTRKLKFKLRKTKKTKRRVKKGGMHHGKHHKKTKKRKTKKGGEIGELVKKGELVKNPMHVNAEKEREEKRLKAQRKRLHGPRPLAPKSGGKRKTRKFKKHFMFNTKGKRYVAKTRKQHLKGVKLGHTHSKPHKKSKK